MTERVLKVISDRVDAVNEYIGEETEISMEFLCFNKSADSNYKR